MKFTFMVDSYIVIIAILSVCLIYAWVLRRDFKEIMHIYFYDLNGNTLEQQPTYATYQIC